MRKFTFKKGNVRRGDKLRALLTEVLPAETPIIFANDGLYENVTNPPIFESEFDEVVQRILWTDRKYTIPVRYNVLQGRAGVRGLSLIHPHAQLQVCDFYALYNPIICDLNANTVSSLRAPVKVGGTFFVRGSLSDVNRLKSDKVDTKALEKSLSNPSSYFVYNKIDRAHKFFDSIEYINLEKKYAYFTITDIQKCFSSIYTHTFYWAIDGVAAAKDNQRSVGFGNDFDRLMQAMNFSETNGICVGPEVSRIFAETLLNAVDRKVINDLHGVGVIWGRDYEFRRYVDDFYIFSRSEVKSKHVLRVLQTELERYGLHLNKSKTQNFERPFVTPQTITISALSQALDDIFNQSIGYDVKVTSPRTVRYAYPRTIRNSNAYIKASIKKLKTCSLSPQNDLHEFSDCIVAAIVARINDLIEGWDFSSQREGVGETELVRAILALLELVFYVFTINPTARGSMDLAKSLILMRDFLRDHAEQKYEFFSQSVIRWTVDLARSINESELHSQVAAIPVELINVIIALREIAADSKLLDELVGEFCEACEKFSYFEIVAFLFVIQGRASMGRLRDKLVKRARAVMVEHGGPMKSSEAAHLFFDIVSCPFVKVEERAKILNLARRQCGLPNVLTQTAINAVSKLDARPWFVDWKRVNLLNMLRKRELNKVY